ncbi:MAG TPA: transcriptional regulator [Allosphingosinicella sp.]|nr:transcriptional regulator [Allosphingosinicella sp.]
MIEVTRYRFGDFILDTRNRQLSRGEAPVELNPRYFDALALLVSEQGGLVGKDRFFEQVWHGVPVGDEALTQCIKTLRQRLGDEAANPRFIQTVPKHGYRFFAAVERVDEEPRAASMAPEDVAPRPIAKWIMVPAVTLGGTTGGALAGAAGGLVYGVAAASGPGVPEVGGSSIVALLVALGAIVGALGGLGVSLGLAAASEASAAPWLRVAGAALGGSAIGAASSMLGVDAFGLLLGAAPVGITGGAEGAALGAALALGLIAGERRAGRWAPALGAGLACAAAGLAIVLAGGRLMAGSLDLLGSSLLGTGAALDRFQPFFAALRFGGPGEALLGALEGLFFGAGAGGAIGLVRRSLGAPRDARLPN